MLHAFKRTNEIITVVAAHTSVRLLNEWFESLPESGMNHTVAREAELHESMTNDDLREFRTNVILIEHASIEDQDSFIEQHYIYIAPHARVLDCANEMLAYREPGDPDPDDGRTIAEIGGIEKSDPWDRRTDDERANQQSDKGKKAKADGLITGESFTPISNKQGAHVTNIDVGVDSNGHMTINHVGAMKNAERTNAVLTVMIGSKKIEKPVMWVGRELLGTQDLAQQLMFGDEYAFERNTGNKPTAMVIMDDFTGSSKVQFNPMIGDFVSDEERRV